MDRDLIWSNKIKGLVPRQVDGVRQLWHVLATCSALMSWLGSTPALADACDAETAALRSMAKGVEVKIDAPKGSMADAPARISWRANERAPLKVPTYIVIAIPGDVRFRVAPVPPKPPAPDSDQAIASRPADLPGFLALTPQTRGPLGLEFGKGATRALIPLHNPTQNCLERSMSRGCQLDC